MSQASDEAGFKKRLGLFDCAMFIAGTMIGSGIFIVSSEMARDVGTSGWLLVVWIVSGVMTILGALSYAELAAMMPHAGGQYVFLRESYSPLFGFLYGWTSFTVIQTGTIAAVAVAFAKFLGVLVPKLGTGAGAMVLYHAEGFHWVLTLPLPWLAEPLTVFDRTEFTITTGHLIAVVLILGLTFWNTMGVEQGKWLQNIFTVAKIGALVVLILVGVVVTFNSDIVSRNFADLWGGMSGTKQFAEVSKSIHGGAVGQAGGGSTASLIAWMVVGGALVGALFSSDAWNNVTFSAAEVRNPRRNLPLSLLIGTGMVTVLYLLANGAYLVSLPLNGVKDGAGVLDRGIAHASDDRVATAMMELAWPGTGHYLMAAAIMVSTFGCINGLILMGARLYYAMARDSLFFGAVGNLNRNGVPSSGLWFQGIWACLLVFSGTYGDLLDYVIFAALLFYAMTVTGLFILRYRRPTMERPYRAIGYPVLPALYVVLCTVVMLDLLVVKPKFTWPGLILVLAGIPVYFLWKGLRSAKS
jgi:APA family basic amino acid/polyamine antiporter